MKSDEQKFLEAKRKVEQVKGFYIHLSTYIILNLIFIAYNYYDNAWAYLWFWWITLGWGIGIVSDYLRAFDKNPFFGRNWEERKINEYMAEQEKQQEWE